MGETVEFRSNGSTANGYLADGGGPGLVVFQEWWGLVPHIKDVVDRFAAEGFTALAPDLYHGESASEPDGAGKLMMALNLDRAAKDMSGAVDYLTERTGRSSIGVTGFCMGGGLALVLACKRPDAVKAVVPWYGVVPWESMQPDWSALEASLLGHYAENDEWASPEVVHALEDELRALGKDVTLHIYPGTEHAFFNDTRPEVHHPEASKTAFDRTVEFLHAQLG
jgi:carboxymethylenebutenolidase